MRTARLRALVTLIAVAATVLPAPVALAASGPPVPVSGAYRWVNSLSLGKSTLVLGNQYDLFSCFATSKPTTLYVQGVNGTWKPTFVTATPQKSKACSASFPWLMHYQWKVNQPGIAGIPGGPRVIQLATGYTAPQWRFDAGVWPTWQACSDAGWNDCS
jgi:hypothetical protein